MRRRRRRRRRRRGRRRGRRRRTGSGGGYVTLSCPRNQVPCHAITWRSGGKTPYILNLYTWWTWVKFMNWPLQYDVEALRKRKAAFPRLPEIELWFLNRPVPTFYADWATPSTLESFNEGELTLQRCFTYVCLVPRTKAHLIYSAINVEFIYSTPTTKSACKSCSLRYGGCSKWFVCASARLTLILLMWRIGWAHNNARK